jgi:hypothetical protein
MKKIKTLLMMLAVIVAAKSFAQTEEARGVRLGIKAGINIANATIKPADAETSKGSLLGITGGVFATIPGGTGFSVQPELNYSGLGVKEKVTNTKLALSYLTLPVLARYSLENAGFAAYLGPQIGYLLSAKAKAGAGSADVKNQFKSTDVSGIIGVEYFLPAGVGLSARYQLGFTNVAKDTEGGESFKNNALTFTLGYRL